MGINDIFGGTIDLLAKTMDLRTKNHNIIAGNLANAETPGYTPTTFSFEKQLRAAVEGKGTAGSTPAITNPRHIPLNSSASTVGEVTGEIVESPGGTPGKDGNSVELEREMGKMLENQIMYNASVQLLTRKLEGLKTAIKGGN
jgi:flagellar basal-body rod protein FlgB